jgi:hypothetical protein
VPDEALDVGDARRRARLRRSGKAATFVAGLELAGQGDATLH